jgi:hypothetical protein
MWYRSISFRASLLMVMRMDRFLLLAFNLHAISFVSDVLATLRALWSWILVFFSFVAEVVE